MEELGFEQHQKMMIAPDAAPEDLQD